jgi:hypothetical protein
MAAMKVQGGKMVPASGASAQPSDSEIRNRLQRAKFIREAQQTIADLSNMRTSLSMSEGFGFTKQRFDALREAERIVLRVLQEVQNQKGSTYS